MLINNISANIQNTKLNKNDYNQKNYASDVSFQGEKGNISKKAAALLALMTMTTLPMGGCEAEKPVQPTVPVPTEPGEYSQVETQDTLDSLGAKLDLVDIGYVSTPVSEFYFTNKGESVVIHPKEDLPRNEEGAVIITISPNVTDNDENGCCLAEIITEVYGDTIISKFEPIDRANIQAKLCDEIIQANPELAKYIRAELGDKADSYNDILSLNLYSGRTSQDETLDNRFLIMPETIFYETQGVEHTDEEFCTSTSTYAPGFSSGSLVKDSDSLLDGEFASMSDMIHSAYGEDISDEAYRDILYAIVNSPLNADKFEVTLGKLNFNELLTTESIHDLNRTLEENMGDVVLDIQLPVVTTDRTQSHSAILTDGCPNEVISQISPAKNKEGLNDLRITILDKNRELQVGDVFALKHVLQYYASPAEHERFAEIYDGEFHINPNVNYAEEFSTQILKQVVYANLDIFMAPYEDEAGFHNYGVFDVAAGSDIEGKSLEEMLTDGTLIINEDRMWNYSFVDANGKSIIPDGETLELPQFNYNISVCEKKPACEIEQPTTPTETEPTTPTETEPTTPTETEPTTPTETEPTTPTETEPTTPTETEPTTPTETEPTTPTETEPTTPTETEPTTPTETEPTTPTCEPEPTEPTIEEPEPTFPTETEPTTPTETEPTTPTETQPTTPTSEPEIPTQPSATDTPPADPTSDPDLPTNPTGEEVDPVEPTQTPTEAPTGEPTTTPTGDPTTEPTGDPTGDPTVEPTCEDNPSDQPTVEEEIPSLPSGEVENPVEPTVDTTPTEAPSSEPTVSPSETPSSDPTTDPTCSDIPSDEPTVGEETPSIPGGVEESPVEPTQNIDPTVAPSVEASQTPSEAPTVTPEVEPTKIPSEVTDQVKDEVADPTASTSCDDVPADEGIVEEEAPDPFATLSASNSAANAYKATVTANASTTNDSYKAPDSVTARLASFFINGNNKEKPKENLYFNA